LRKHGQRQQVRIVKPGSSFDLVDQAPDLLIRLIQAQRVGQGQWRRLVIEVHLPQGIIADTTEVGDFEQLLIRKCVSRVTDAPQQGQSIPVQRPLEGVAPGAQSIVLEERLIRRRILRVEDAPVIQVLVVVRLIELALLANEGLAVEPIHALRVGPDSCWQDNIAGVGIEVGFPQANRAIGPLDRLQVLDHGFGGGRAQAAYALAHCAHYANQCQVLRHIDQMRLGSLVIAF